MIIPEDVQEEKTALLRCDRPLSFDRIDPRQGGTEHGSNSAAIWQAAVASSPAAMLYRKARWSVQGQTQ